MTDTVDLTGSAAKYAAAGFSVLPLHSVRDGRCTCGRVDCRTPGKHPLTVNGLHDASTEPGRVAAWWRTHPWANVGVRPRAGLVVLDVDPRNGGDGGLSELLSAHGDLPTTLTARTGSGGLHIWVRYSGPVRGRLCPGVDLKTSSGYLVAPPSLHASGERYRWLTRLPIAPAPEWLSRMIGPSRGRVVPRIGARPTSARGDGLVRTVANAPEGRRNAVLNWASYTAFQLGGDPGLIAEIREAALSTGLPPAEVDRTIGSAARAVSR